MHFRRAVALLFVVFFFSLFFVAPSQAASFTVTSNSDGATNGICDVQGRGDGCTLREALRAAESNAGTDAIVFKIGATGTAQSIKITSALPEITVQGGPVFINGFSQGGASYGGLPLIELNGDGIAADGIVISAGGSTIRGLVINRFAGSAIRLTVGGGNAI